MKLKCRNLLLKATTLAIAAGIPILSFMPAETWAADSLHSEVSFTVRTVKEENVEGPDVGRTYFMAGGKRIAFGMPKNCRLSTSGSGFLILLADAGLDGEIHITRSPFTPESDLAADALKYRDAATQGMPGGAANVEVRPPMMDPYPYNGWKSLGFTWTYTSYGRPMVRTVSYVNLEVGVQLVVTTLAAKGDAEKVGKIARQFMSSWWVMRG
jgi:hypothetical protein